MEGTCQVSAFFHPSPQRMRVPQNMGMLKYDKEYKRGHPVWGEGWRGRQRRVGGEAKAFLRERP